MAIRENHDNFSPLCDFLHRTLCYTFTHKHKNEITKTSLLNTKNRIIIMGHQLIRLKVFIWGVCVAMANGHTLYLHRVRITGKQLFVSYYSLHDWASRWIH